MKIDQLKENMQSWWNNVAEGWQHLWKSKADALTQFKPDQNTNLPESAHIDDQAWLPSQSWSILGGDVFEDGERLVIRLETPGMEKENLNLEVTGEKLIISGEKRFEQETTEGRWRIMQCAYGTFRREIPLPAPVKADAAQASYKNGILRVELPKENPGKPKSINIKVQ
ncbi:MAG: Hsp20/alpha crystallin family protein [Azovibrio sp.]